MSAFGPGSAFGSFAPIGGQSGAQRPSRGRMTSSGSFKDLTSATNHTDQSWDTSASDLHTPNSSALLQNGSASNDALTANSDSLTSASTHNRANGSDSSTKRFVYSREFLLSLYDDEKVQKRPVELSKHAIATLEQARAPWALKGFKEGERELFSSIHPPNMRSNRNQTQNSNRNAGGSNESSNMLDLASLGALPRDRDRLRGSNVASTSAGNATEEGATGVRRAKSVHSTGILGGVLDGIAPAAPRRRDSSFEKGKGAEDESPADTVPKADLQPWTAATSKDSSLLEPLQPAGKDEEGEVNDLAPSKEQLPLSVQQVQTGFGSLSLGPDSLFDDPLLGSLRPSSAAKAQPSSLFQAPAAPIREPTPEPVINDPNWQYRDPSGQVQGPFPAKLMHDWYCQHFFTGDLMVKRVSDTDYETLDDLIRRCGSAEKPFLDGVSLASAAKKKDKPVVAANTASQPASAQESSARFGENSSFPKQDGLDRSVTESLWGGAPAQGHQNIALDASARRDAGANLLAQLQRSSQSPAFDAAPRVDLLQQLLAQQQLHSSQQQQHPLYGISGLLPQHQQFGAANAPLPPPVYHGDFVQQQQQHQQMQHAMWQQQQQFPFGPGAAVSGAPTMPSQHSSAPQVAHPGPFAASPPAPQPVTSPWLSGEPVAVPVTESHPQHLSPQQQHQQHQYQHQEAHRSPEPSVSAAPSAKSPAEQVASLPEARASQEQYQPQDEQPAAAHPAKPVVPAPWVKAEEEKQANATPSLREIQEAEAKALEAKRAAEKAQQARLQAAAAMRAAQQAAAEAESLPSSSTWANTNSTPSASPTGVKAPWLNRSSSTGAGKTLKEIQEEEERERQKAAAQAAAQQQAVGAGPRGYASLASKPSNPGAGWTTVAAKPTPTASQAPKQRPVIPGLLAPASSSASVTKLATAAPAASRPAAPVVAAKSSTPVKAAAVQSASPAAAARPRANGPQSYSIDNPPPPSSEFMKWCREALKGLNVPMDEFIQMLLSFPLDASPDVLEIISDSVYANSSTLDGRRFANDFTSRRKLDVAARYPQILSLPKSALVNGSGVRPAAGAATSMADALKMPPQPKPTEWSVPVGQKKKGKAQR